MASSISPFTSGAIDSLLSSVLNPATGGGSASNADDPRVPYLLTSTMRQQLLSKTADRLEDLQTQLNGAADARKTLNNVGILQQKALTSIGITDAQIAQQIEDLSGQMDGAMPEIFLEINPKSVVPVQPKRFTRQDTMGGTDFHHFTDKKGYNNDVLTLSFAGNTGNIAIDKNQDPEARDRATKRISILHNLYQLTREPRLLLPAGTTNIISITFQSMAFPIPIQFDGFFPRVLDYALSAEKPNSVEWKFDFIVQATTPDLNTLTQTIMDFVKQQTVALPGPNSTILTQPR